MMKTFEFTETQVFLLKTLVDEEVDRLALLAKQDATKHPEAAASARRLEAHYRGIGLLLEAY